MEFVTGDRGAGKTTAMLNWFFTPDENFSRRLIFVMNQAERERIVRIIRTYCVSNHVSDRDRIDILARVVVCEQGQPPLALRSGLVQVWVDNFDLLISRMLGLFPYNTGFLAPIQFTFTSTEPVHVTRLAPYANPSL